MSFSTLSPEEQIKRYAKERRRVFALRRHLKNTTRLLVLERGWLLEARRERWEAFAREREWRDKYLKYLRGDPQAPVPECRLRWELPVLTLTAGFFAGMVLMIVLCHQLHP